MFFVFWNVNAFGIEHISGMVTYFVFQLPAVKLLEGVSHVVPHVLPPSITDECTYI